MAERVILCVAPDVGQEMRADQQARPPSEEDALGQEEVDQVTQGRTQACGRLVEDRDRQRVGFAAGAGVGGGEQCRECGLVVGVGGQRAARLVPALAHRLGARVRFQAPYRAAPAAPAAQLHGGVAPFEGHAAAVLVEQVAVVDTGADSGTDEGDGRGTRVAATAEPHLGLAERLGAVVDEERHLRRDPDGVAEQPLEGDGTPVDGLAVHDGPHITDRTVRRVALDDAGDADPDAEEPARVGVGVPQHVGDPAADVADDAVDVVAVLGQQSLGAGEFGESEVEELDPDPRLPDVDADEEATPGRDAQQRAGTAAVGIDDSGFLQETLRGKFRDDVADGTRTQPRRGTELLTAQRAVEIQPLQNPRPVAPSQVTHGPSVALSHVAPSLPATYRDRGT